MKAVRYVAYMLAMAVALLTFPVISHAATATASLRVSVVVRSWVKLTSEQHVHSYKVTRADIEKGYIDLPRIATLNLRTNEHKEQMVMVSHEGTGILTVSVGGETIAAGSGIINMGMSQPGTHTIKTIDGRLYLPKDISEGEYPLVLSLTTQ